MPNTTNRAKAAGSRRGRPGQAPPDPADALGLPELCECYEYLRRESEVAYRDASPRDRATVLRVLARKEQELASALEVRGRFYDHGGFRYHSTDGETLYRRRLGPRPAPPRVDADALTLPPEPARFGECEEATAWVKRW